MTVKLVLLVDTDTPNIKTPSTTSQPIILSDQTFVEEWSDTAQSMLVSPNKTGDQPKTLTVYKGQYIRQ